MRKLLLLIVIVFLVVSCDCEIKPISTQYVPVDENCEAFLPDYTGHVISFNCNNVLVTQAPPVGTKIGKSKKVILLVKTDEKTQTLKFDVYPIDTISPVIKPNFD